MPIIQDRIIDWYSENKRDLPWRKTTNPYHIWLSEIILQQTRVQQGLNYYLKFTKNYPTIIDLANSSEQEVLKDWQGLGYYSRARNLHATAKFIQKEYDGKFPSIYSEIIKLKGIGEYTAAAISSFSFGLHHAVLDGNVFRVLSRIFDIETPINSTEGKKIFSKLADELLPNKNSAIYNQAIMEFGALLCVPSNPDCENCPIQHKCLSFAHKTIPLRPQKINKTKITDRFFNYLVFNSSTEIIIQKRTKNDIWKNMYEFPNLIKFSRKENSKEEIIREIEDTFGLKIKTCIELKKHILSHQHIFSRFFVINHIPDNITRYFDEILKVQKSHLSEYPIPKLIDKFLNSNDIF